MQTRFPVTGQAPLDANSVSYDVMFRTAATQLGVGLSVIVDCPLARRELFTRAFEIAEKACKHPQETALMGFLLLICYLPSVLKDADELAGQRTAASAGEERCDRTIIRLDDMFFFLCALLVHIS